MTPSPKSLEETLREAVRESGLTTTQLSQLTGISRPRIHDFVNGGGLRISTAQKLMDHFGFRIVK